MGHSFTAVYLLQGFAVALLLRDVSMPVGIILLLAWGAVSLSTLIHLERWLASRSA